MAAHCQASTATVEPDPDCCRRCTPAAAIEIFGQVKAAFDPENLLNPGVLVDPSGERRSARGGWLAGSTTSGAVHRCSGVGKCLPTRRPVWG